MKSKYSVDILYRSMFYPELDNKIESLMRRPRDASGMGFGQRDMTFVFKKKSSAKRAFEKLSKIKNLTKVSLVVDRDV